MPARASLLLGAAFDDRGRRAASRVLTWYAGRKRLGTGEKLACPPPRRALLGSHLVARDRDGRAGVAALKVRVRRDPLRITRIGYKARVPRAAAGSLAPDDPHVGAGDPPRTRASLSLRLGARARRVVSPLPRRPAAGALADPGNAGGVGRPALDGHASRLRRG